MNNCNTCTRPADSPYRYKNIKDETRGCVDKCHDEFIAVNRNPYWMERKHMVLPKWITDCRRAIKQMKEKQIASRTA